MSYPKREGHGPGGLIQIALEFVKSLLKKHGWTWNDHLPPKDDYARVGSALEVSKYESGERHFLVILQRWEFKTPKWSATMEPYRMADLTANGWLIGYYHDKRRAYIWDPADTIGEGEFQGRPTMEFHIRDAVNLEDWLQNPVLRERKTLQRRLKV